MVLLHAVIKKSQKLPQSNKEEGGEMRQGSRCRRPLTWMRAGVALLVLLVAFDASALRKVAPGKDPGLGPGDGLLVLSVDTSAPVSSVQFKKAGSLWTGGALRNIETGRTRQLFVVPAGQYQWARVTLSSNDVWRTYFTLADDPEYRFEVRAGQITYAGDLILRPQTPMSTSIHVANRSLPVIDWLQASHPALYAAHPFAYSGHYPDPFPEMYRATPASAAARPADFDSGRPPSDPGPLPLAPAVLWAPERVRDMALSPDGALVVLERREAEAVYVLDLIDLQAGLSQRIAKSDTGFGTLVWESDRILLAGTPTPVGERLRAFLIDESAAGQRRVRQFVGPVGGSIVDLLPDKPGRILYEAYDGTGTFVVHALVIDQEKAFRSFDRNSTWQRLNRGVADDFSWFADGEGRLRATLAKSGEDVVLMHGLDGQFREVLRFQGTDAFVPVQMSHDGNTIYGLTDENRAQRDLVVFDPAQGRITRTLFSKPGVDVDAPLFDERRRPIGVTYYEAGRLISHYFDDDNRQLDARLRASFPGSTVATIARSRDGRHRLLWVDGSDLPPRLYYLDAGRNHAELIDEAMPALAGRSFVPAQLLKVERPGQPTIDAFVTVPPARGKRPLVVMPHGGPMGVADSVHFDREVQFLASLGYAVLQVNFRGSDGYGRAFREAARGQYGTGIEDDIDAALQAALARFPLDSERMCMLGSSYGGYSSLVSAIRWPGRFRCAVSISGISDSLLFFTASDSARSAQGRSELQHWIGDPEKDHDAMRAASPLYQYDRLDLPLMLVHGEEDLRVDFEHTRRLVRMLSLAGRPPVLQTFPDEGHGIVDPKAQNTAWTGIAGFLRKHLGVGADATSAAGPAAAAD